jgi:hypothetical protein
MTKLSSKTMERIDKVVAPGTNILRYYEANFGPNMRPNC